MHVAYIHQHFATPRQADGTRSYEFARALEAAGHRVTMIAGAGRGVGLEDRPPGRRVIEKHIDGIDVKYINVAYDNSMGPIRRWVSFSRFAAMAVNLAVRSAADIVFATSTPLTVGPVGRRASARLGVPLVFEVRDIWPQLLIEMGALTNPLAKWYMRRMELATYRAARHVVVLAPGMTEHIVASGVPADRITFIPNSCDLDLFRPDNPPSTDYPYAAGDEFKLVFSGAHGRANGLDVVLDAAAELNRRGVRGLRFVFIGAGGQRDRLIRRARDEGLEDLTAFHLGVPKTELAKVLPRMNVGMQILANVPGFYNGTSPNKFFDYIAAGLPVLNNYPGWLAGLIEANHCGVVAPPGDPAALADKVLWMRDHPDELKTMGANARALAEREFSRQVMARRFIDLLERVQRAK